MKKTILKLTASAFIAGAILTSCSTSAEKVENAQKNVNEANKDLDNANQEYLVDIENYRKETSNMIVANEQQLAEFKVKIEHEKKVARTEYRKQIAELEQKNNDMKIKMSNYNEGGKEKWEKFKTEFSHDMDELGQAFKDLTVNNVK
jgi:F0F1-type ATP synthase membrane subunit b/b'